MKVLGVLRFSPFFSFVLQELDKISTDLQKNAGSPMINKKNEFRSWFDTFSAFPDSAVIICQNSRLCINSAENRELKLRIESEKAGHRIVSSEDTAVVVDSPLSPVGNPSREKMAFQSSVNAFPPVVAAAAAAAASSTTAALTAMDSRKQDLNRMIKEDLMYLGPDSILPASAPFEMHEIAKRRHRI